MNVPGIIADEIINADLNVSDDLIIIPSSQLDMLAKTIARRVGRETANTLTGIMEEDE